MRPYQVFAGMDPEHARGVLQTVQKHAPGVFQQALQAACAALKVRPVYLLRQPPEKQLDAVRRALARVAADPLAEELLAVYFLECRKPLLIEWLECVGLEHEDGVLQSISPPPPPRDRLEEALRSFRAGAEAADRELLLRAFSAQSAVAWPDLDALIQTR